MTTTKTNRYEEFLDKAIDCADTRGLGDAALDLLPQEQTEQTPVCPFASQIGGAALETCRLCEFRPGVEFVRQSLEISPDTAPVYNEAYRRAVRDNLTTSKTDQSKPAPVANEFYRVALTTDLPKSRLERIARITAPIQLYTRDIEALREHGSLYAQDIERLRAEKELAVSLLTVPPIIQRNRNRVLAREAGQETQEMTELMNRLFDYCVTHDDVSTDTLQQLMNGFIGDAPEHVRKEIEPRIVGTTAEVAVFRTIQGQFRHGTVDEDRKGKDFVSVSNPNNTIDVKCWRYRPVGDNKVEVTEPFFDQRTKRLYIPRSGINPKTMTLDAPTEAAVKRLLKIRE